MKKLSLFLVTLTGFGRLSAQNVPNGTTTLVPFVSNSIPSGVANSDASLNFTRTFIPLRQITNSGDPVFNINATGALMRSVNTTYTNGWGSALESIQRGYSDCIIQPFDNRPSNTKLGYLPYRGAGGTNFVPLAITADRDYYASKYPSDAEHFFSKTVTSLDPGIVSTTSYRPGSSFEGTNNGTIVYNKSNVADDHILIFNSGATVPAGEYHPGELSLKQTIKSDGAVTLEFSDKNGRLVCKKVMASESAYGAEYLTTFYVYNDLGLLTDILTPEAVAAVASGPPYVDVSNLVFHNDYNALGSVIMKTTPGKQGAEYFIYDQKNRLVLYQSPTLRAAGKYKFNLYDRRDRVVISGLFTDPNDHTTWQNWLITPPVTIEPGSLLYYALTDITGAYPTTIPHCEIEQLNFYDRYAVPRTFNSSYSSDYSLGTGVVAPVPYMVATGLTTATISRVRNGGMSASDDKWVCSVYFYDVKGQLIQVQSLNPTTAQSYTDCLIGAPSADWDVSTNVYYFNGGVKTNVSRVYDNTPGTNKPTTKILKQYIRDDWNGGRLKLETSRIDDGAGRTLAEYTYDEMGKVSVKKFGNVETQKYEYNIQGLLTAINRDYAETPCGPSGAYSTFGCILNYEYGFSNPKFDGSISGFMWRGASHTTPLRAYGYNYDLAGRLTSADFRQYCEPTTDAAGCGLFGPDMSWNKEKTDFTVSNIAYDLNGNILSMLQRGTTPSGPVDMDDLTYTYIQGTNQLESVADAVPDNYHLGEFVDVTSTCGVVGGYTWTCPDYTYDENGNLKSDANKAITNITYNEMDQPLQVTYASGTNINNTYTADGTLFTKVVQTIGPISTLKEYKYLGGLVFENNKLDYLLHDEGRARYDESTGFFTYDYFIKDHLGNVRSVVTGNQSNDPSGISPTGGGVYTYVASHELAAAGTENLYFTNIEEVRDDKPDPTIDDKSAARLNGGEDGRRVGTTLMLKVMAGDAFDVSSQAYWEDYQQNPQEASTDDMMGELIHALHGSGPSLVADEQTVSRIIDGTISPNNYYGFLSAFPDAVDESKPKAFLDYMVFDENMNLVKESSGTLQVGESGAWTMIGTGEPISILRDGYLVISIRNISWWNVFFDGIHVNHYQGSLLQEQHYYPHGLCINTSENPTVSKNRYKYQGKELIDDAGLNLYDFTARQYDPQIGRFWGIDPADQFPSGYTGMGNDPANSIDPTGMIANAHYGDFATQNLWKGTQYNNEMNVTNNSPQDWELEAKLFNAQEQAAFEQRVMQDKLHELNPNNSEITLPNKIIAVIVPIENMVVYASAGDGRGSTVSKTPKSGQSSSAADGGKNYFGDNYTGPDNPRSGYLLKPKNMRDAVSLTHDKGYDMVGAKGADGVFTNGYALPFDYEFIKDQTKLGITLLSKSMTDPTLANFYRIEAAKSFLVGSGMFLGTLPKLILNNPYKITYP